MNRTFIAFAATPMILSMVAAVISGIRQESVNSFYETLFFAGVFSYVMLLLLGLPLHRLLRWRAYTSAISYIVAGALGGILILLLLELIDAFLGEESVREPTIQFIIILNAAIVSVSSLAAFLFWLIAGIGSNNR